MFTTIITNSKITDVMRLFMAVGAKWSNDNTKPLLYSTIEVTVTTKAQR